MVGAEPGAWPVFVAIGDFAFVCSHLLNLAKLSLNEKYG